MLNFSWDRRKADANWQKHGVSFDEAMTIFGDPFELMIADPEHSGDEERSISVGRAESGRILFVVYAQVENELRLISARESEAEESTAYLAVSGDY